MRSGGLYAVEDLNWQPSQLEQPDVPKTVELLRSLQRGEQVRSPCWSERQTNYIVDNTQEVCVYDSRQGKEEGLTGALCILMKK